MAEIIGRQEEDEGRMCWKLFLNELSECPARFILGTHSLQTIEGLRRSSHAYPMFNTGRFVALMDLDYC